ncbi:MAG: exonuclease SbcCD subunit D [Anaerolineae bacterium]|nr:exonuclease SbcCD subunit D [Anaerolineae bacterium]
MIKLLHFADVHIGMENYGKTNPSTGLSSRVMDFLRRMDEMVDYARKNDVDLTIFAGDAFKSRNPNPTFQREFAFRVQDLAAVCPVVLLVGNHDLPTNIRRASSIEIYNTLRVPNVYVGMEYEVLPLETKSGLVQVATAPYPVRAQLLEGEDDTHGMGISELDELMQDVLHQHLAKLADQVAQSEEPRVLTGHFTIDGAVTGSERQIMLGRDVAALLSSVASPIWDYVAMGHVHKFQDLTAGDRFKPPVVYSGSLERIDFGEEGDPKGFVWVNLERGSTSYQFVPVKSRPFVTLRCDVRTSLHPTQDVLKHIKNHHLEEAVVRLIITCDPETESMLQTREIEDALRHSGTNFIAAIHKNVERPARLRLGTNPEGLTPHELLLRYFDSRSIEPERLDTLLEAADAIFRAVDERL